MSFSKPVKQTIHEEGHMFFQKCLVLLYMTSLKSRNEWVLAIVRCFRFSFLFLVMLILHVQNLGSRFIAKISLYGKNPHKL